MEIANSSEQVYRSHCHTTNPALPPGQSKKYSLILSNNGYREALNVREPMTRTPNGDLATAV